MSPFYFSLPLAPWEQPLSFRAAWYERRKDGREHKELGEGNVAVDEISNVNTNDDDASVTRNTRRNTLDSSPKSSLILSPDEAHQYRIAGQPFHKKLPGYDFPHARPGWDKTTRITKRDIETELSQLSPPLFISEPANQSSLRLQHLAVITTILHKCLLEGDYTRAGRAWGLILRDEFGGHAVDVRNGGRWGVGAEILLWNDKDTVTAQSSGMETKGNSPRRRRWFTRKGFECAKSYYERLVLQFPYRKSAPRALGPLDFYPAMFGLWISLVQEESQSAREEAPDMMEDMENFDMFQDEMSISSNIPRKNGRKDDIIANARRKELEEAHRISVRMDELVISPPFSDSYELLRLRGMVSLWIADLFISSVSPDNGDAGSVGNFGDENMLSEEGSGGHVDSELARMEHGLRMERKMAEVEKANSFFERAKREASRKQSALPSDEMDEGEDMDVDVDETATEISKIIE
ncbi:hypothetical protein GX48_05644 [Paracoccidioides brasiliensis]|nr:hypothetical protein GX48_05644 [Paracoccidioides brasiliensis]